VIFLIYGIILFEKGGIISTGWGESIISLSIFTSRYNHLTEKIKMIITFNLLVFNILRHFPLVNVP